MQFWDRDLPLRHSLRGLRGLFQVPIVWLGLDEGIPGRTTEDTKDTERESSSKNQASGYGHRSSGTTFFSCVYHFALFVVSHFLKRFIFAFIRSLDDHPLRQLTTWSLPTSTEP